MRVRPKPAIAASHDEARVALAWLHARPGVSIGERTLEQLEDNVKALEVRPSAEQTAALDELSTPQLPFPIPFLRMTQLLHAGGTTVNGEPSDPHRFIAKDRDDHYSLEASGSRIVQYPDSNATG